MCVLCFFHLQPKGCKQDIYIEHTWSKKGKICQHLRTTGLLTNCVGWKAKTCPVVRLLAGQTPRGKGEEGRKGIAEYINIHLTYRQNIYRFWWSQKNFRWMANDRASSPNVLASTFRWYKVPGSKSFANFVNYSKCNEQSNASGCAWITMLRLCVMIRLACRMVCLNWILHWHLLSGERLASLQFPYALEMGRSSHLLLCQATRDTSRTLCQNLIQACQLEYKIPQTHSTARYCKAVFKQAWFKLSSTTEITSNSTDGLILCIRVFATWLQTGTFNRAKSLSRYKLCVFSSNEQDQNSSTLCKNLFE